MCVCVCMCACVRCLFQSQYLLMSLYLCVCVSVCLSVRLSISGYIGMGGYACACVCDIIGSMYGMLSFRQFKDSQTRILMHVAKIIIVCVGVCVCMVEGVVSEWESVCFCRSNPPFCLSVS